MFYVPSTLLVYIFVLMLIVAKALLSSLYRATSLLHKNFPNILNLLFFFLTYNFYRYGLANTKSSVFTAECFF